MALDKPYHRRKRDGKTWNRKKNPPRIYSFFSGVRFGLSVEHAMIPTINLCDTKNLVALVWDLISLLDIVFISFQPNATFSPNWNSYEQFSIRFIFLSLTLPLSLLMILLLHLPPHKKTIIAKCDVAHIHTMYARLREYVTQKHIMHDKTNKIHFLCKFHVNKKINRQQLAGYGGVWVLWINISRTEREAAANRRRSTFFRENSLLILCSCWKISLKYKES